MNVIVLVIEYTQPNASIRHCWQVGCVGQWANAVLLDQVASSIAYQAVLPWYEFHRTYWYKPSAAGDVSRDAGYRARY